MDRARRDPNGYPPGLAPVPRLSLTLEEAAAALGVSLAHFRRHVLPDLAVVRSGSVRLVRVSELDSWIQKNSTIAGAA